MSVLKPVTAMSKQVNWVVCVSDAQFENALHYSDCKKKENNTAPEKSYSPPQKRIK